MHRLCETARTRAAVHVGEFAATSTGARMIIVQHPLPTQAEKRSATAPSDSMPNAMLSGTALQSPRHPVRLHLLTRDRPTYVPAKATTRHAVHDTFTSAQTALTRPPRHTHVHTTCQELYGARLQLAVGTQDGDAELRGDDELVPLKQALRDVLERLVARHVHQQPHALLQRHLLAQPLRLRHLHSPHRRATVMWHQHALSSSQSDTWALRWSPRAHCSSGARLRTASRC